MTTSGQAQRFGRRLPVWPVTLFLLAMLCGPSGGVADDGSPCLDALAAFAAEKGVDFDPESVTFGDRWASAAHEVQKLPGSRARLAQESCDGALAVDLTPECRIIKSQGEDGCKAAYPLSFH